MLLEVKDLHVEVAGREILKGIDLTIGLREAVILMGPNGSGKSTLINAIMGHPNYNVTRGHIIFRGREITSLPTEERTNLGLGVSFQIPPKIRGVRLDVLLKSIASKAKLDRGSLERYVNLLDMKEFLERDLNVGFSGGEMKRAELLLLLARRPSLSLIDEPDSGIDVESIQLVAKAIEEILKPVNGMTESAPSALIVTHHGQIVNYLRPSRAYVILDGRIACFGEAKAIVESIMSGGFERCAECFAKRA